MPSTDGATTSSPGLWRPGAGGASPATRSRLGRGEVRLRRSQAHPRTRERARNGTLNRIVPDGISKHGAAVHDDGESFADLVSEAQPHAPRRIESDDLDPDLVSEVPEQVFGEVMGPIRVLEDKRRRLAEFLIPQFRHASVRERLRARGPARLQDRREQAEELDARRPGGHDIECANVRKSLPGPVSAHVDELGKRDV